MKAAQGILTVRGGMTSHAAVVARGMGNLLCIRMRRDRYGRGKQEICHLAGKEFHEGDWLSHRRFHR